MDRKPDTVGSRYNQRLPFKSRKDIVQVIRKTQNPKTDHVSVQIMSASAKADVITVCVIYSH